jgi:hypothetical protein
MSRKLMAMLVSSTLVLGSISTSAWSAPETAGATQAQAAQNTASPKNFSPLPAGGAAGIKQAQGIEDSPWLGIGIVAAIVVVAWILLDDDDSDDEEAPSTGTN